MEGKIFVRLDHGKGLRDRELTVGCNLPGKWILHWGVTYVDDVGRYIMLNNKLEFSLILVLRCQVIMFLILLKCRRILIIIIQLSFIYNDDVSLIL